MGENSSEQGDGGRGAQQLGFHLERSLQSPGTVGHQSDSPSRDG